MGNIYVGDTSAGKTVSAWVVLNRKGESVATIRAHYGNSRVLVNIHDSRDGFQYASASGYGYDKLTAALSGLTVDGHKLSDHCGERIKPPRGLPFFPRDYKPRKGYALANYGTWEKTDSGKYERRDSYHWRDMAMAQWRAANGKAESDYPDNESWERIQETARQLELQAADSGRLYGGFSSCFRQAGLRYLEAIGYRVIQAI